MSLDSVIPEEVASAAHFVSQRPQRLKLAAPRARSSDVMASKSPVCDFVSLFIVSVC